MINGNYSEFLDHLYYGDELYLKYKEVVYFIQGWTRDIEKTCLPEVMECVRFDHMQKISSIIFHAEDKSMQECAHQFLDTPLFDGKKLVEIENDVEWVDSYLG